MRFCPLFFFLPYLLTCAISTDAALPTSSLAPITQLPPEKHFYELLPKEDSDTIQTSNLIKNVVHTEHIFPQTDFQDQLMLWIVEVSAKEVSQLKPIEGIDHVEMFDVSTSRIVAQRISESTTTEDLSKLSLSGLSSRDDTLVKGQHYVVVPRDYKNKKENKKTEDWLRENLGKSYHDSLIMNDKLWYWECTMTGSQLDKVKRYKGVGDVEAALPAHADHHIPNSKGPPVPTTTTAPMAKMNKRDFHYITQSGALTELVSISQPSTIPDIRDLDAYVFDDKGVHETWVYHIEAGVGFKGFPEEFRNVVPDDQHLQTDMARRRGRHPWDDASSAEGASLSHSTCTANKAVGWNYGSSKHSNLVVVQYGQYELPDMTRAVNLIRADITARPERRKFSVATLSVSIPEPRGARLRVQTAAFRAAVEMLVDMDVPLFTSAGNRAEERDSRGRPRLDIDTFPGIWAGPDFPIVAVGSATAFGGRTFFSQAGPHVTIHAVGEANTCVDRDGANMVDQWGTSFSCPLVAGHVASMLSHSTVPFDTSDGNLVLSMWQYLQTDAASWARDPNQPEIRSLWNGVTEVDNPRTFACHGLIKSQYSEPNTLIAHIETEFCPDVVKAGGPDPGSGSILRRYSIGSPEETAISLDVTPGSPLPSSEECIKMFRKITDNCDGNNPENPNNYKGGGKLTMRAHTYHIDPQYLRILVDDPNLARCTGKTKNGHTAIEIKGRGWSVDNAGALFDKFASCEVYTEGRSFTNLWGEEGQSWLAKFTTSWVNKGCIIEIGKTLSGTNAFDCR